MVLSGRYNFENRDNMRQVGLMKYHSDSITVKFIIGNRPCRVPLALRSTPYTCIGGRETDAFKTELQLLNDNVTVEKLRFNDIVEVDMIDYYRSLPKKLKLAYKWGVENTNSEWFFKIDDDCFFNSGVIDDYFSSLRYEDKLVLIGNMVIDAEVPTSGKWMELDYRKPKYPPFPKGSLSHVANRRFANYVADHVDELFEYQGEDVSTGIWVDENIPNVSIINEQVLLSSKVLCNKNTSWACGHDLKLHELKSLVTL